MNVKLGQISWLDSVLKFKSHFVCFILEDFQSTII
jgi:hypothetical protein